MKKEKHSKPPQSRKKGIMLTRACLLEIETR